MNFFRIFIVLALISINLPCFSLTLGDVKVNSYVNQNLDADIEVLSVGKIRNNNIKAFLAPVADFKKFDIVRDNALDNIRFTTYQEESGKVYIHLSSSKVMREPLISLLVNIRTVEGNISREYNLFLDPSPYTQLQPAKVSNYRNRPHNSKPNQNKTIIEELDEIVSPTEEASPRGQSAFTHKSGPAEYRSDLDYLPNEYSLTDSYGPIKPGNLLTIIAQEIRPDDSYAVQKISKLLYQYNPGAFLNGDINRLKLGAILKFPALDKPELRKNSLSYLDKDSLENIDQQTEKNTIKNQSDLETDASIADKPPQGSAADAIESGSNSAQLRLISEDTTINTESLIDELDISGQSLNTQEIIDLSVSKYKILKDENKELRQQFTLVMDKMEVLINKNADLDSQLGIFKSKQGQSKDKTVPVIKENLPISNNDKNINIATNTATKESSQNKLMGQDWPRLLALLILIVVIIVIAYVILKKYRNRPEASEEFNLDKALDDITETKVVDKKSQIKAVTIEPVTVEPDLLTVKKTEDNKLVQQANNIQSDIKSDTQTSEEFVLDNEEELEFDLDLDTDELGSIETINISAPEESQQEETGVKNTEKQNNLVANVSSSHTESGAQNISFNDILGPSKTLKPDANVDLISQSSVYFAYGKFDLAEKLLLEGITENPQQDELKLKLFECYAKMDDEAKFLAYLEQVKEKYSEDQEFNQGIKKIYLSQWDKELF